MQDKIRNLRKVAGKRNNRGGIGDKNHNPAPKRRKLDEHNVYSEEKKVEQVVVTEALGEKRKSQDTEMTELPKPKRRRMFQQDIILLLNAIVNPDKGSTESLTMTNLNDCRIVPQQETGARTCPGQARLRMRKTVSI